MGTPPLLTFHNNVLTVKISNSKRNSALLIYEINLSVDQNKKEVYLSANQAAGKDYKDTFVLTLNDFGISKVNTYEFYWLDPDNKTTKLNIELEK